LARRFGFCGKSDRGDGIRRRSGFDERARPGLAAASNAAGNQQPHRLVFGPGQESATEVGEAPPDRPQASPKSCRSEKSSQVVRRPLHLVGRLWMLDDNWETLSGPVAHEIEILNATNQLNLVEALVTYSLAKAELTGDGNNPIPTEADLIELHKAGTRFLLEKPGHYRDRDLPLRVPTYAPWQNISVEMQDFFVELKSRWSDGDACDVASFALWKLLWIHPFRNGNGRTARAFAYACLCMKMGMLLPGSLKVVDQLEIDPGRYVEALQAADKTFQDPAIKEPNLEPLKHFLQEALQMQMQKTNTV
jgi:fido (protein-threonine AMPylation protein)